MKRIPFPVRDTVLDGNGPVRPEGPSYMTPTSSSQPFSPAGLFDLPIQRPIVRGELPHTVRQPEIHKDVLY